MKPEGLSSQPDHAEAFDSRELMAELLAEQAAQQAAREQRLEAADTTDTTGARLSAPDQTLASPQSHTDYELSHARLERLNREWWVVTELAQREMAANPAIEHILADYATAELSETLAATVMQELANADEAIKQRWHRYQAELGAFLEQPPVPDEQIQPDIFNARGLSFNDKHTIGRRYAYGRDIKLLGLSAAIHQAGGIEFHNNEAKLSNGIRLVTDPEHAKDNAVFLDPANWQDRRQLKDRVYKITVAGQNYILKERKTNRHTDTFHHGHVDGNTAAQEFAIGNKLHDQATVTTGDVQLNWEHPLGYVEFPDGFQFIVLDYEPDMIIEQSASDPDNTEAAATGTVLHELQEALIAAGHAPGAAADQAMEMYTAGSLAYFKAIEAHHIYKADLNNGLGYRIHQSGQGHVQLEVVGFDYEYFLPESARPKPTLPTTTPSPQGPSYFDTDITEVSNGHVQN